MAAKYDETLQVAIERLSVVDFDASLSKSPIIVVPLSHIKM